MVAFNGVAMANDIAEEKVDKILIVDCAEKAADYLAAKDPNNRLSSEPAFLIYQAYYDRCIEANKPQPSLNISKVLRA